MSLIKDAKNSNLDHSNPSNFIFRIGNYPEVAFFCQSVQLPGLQLGMIDSPTKLPGDDLNIDDLVVYMIIDEDFENYWTIYQWMLALKPLSAIEQSDKINFNKRAILLEEQLQDYYSDIAISILNNNKSSEVMRFLFTNCFPTSISSLKLESGADPESLVLEVVFRFTSLKVINNEDL